jgi:hypothetical protein
MHLPKRYLAALVAAVALAVGLPVAPSGATTPSHPSAVVAKSCPSGFTKARINGSTKCLHAGEFCSNAFNRQYKRYGFRCVNRRLRSA